jgi:Tol biopolymer transport system component
LNLTKGCDKDDTSPAFSPDGTQIAYRSECGGGGIFVMGATGESLRRVTDFGHDPSWSPDGREIAVADERAIDPYLRYQVSALWAVRVADGSKRLVTKGDAVQPAWSPHGDRIAFWRARDEKASQRDLATVPASGASDESAIVAVMDDPAVDWSPAWSPDGKYLYFASDRGGTMNLWRVAIDEGTGRVLGQPEPLTTPSLAAERPSLARGRLVAYASVSTRSSLFRIALDDRKGVPNGSPTEIWSSSGTLQDADVSPDGQWIVLRHSTGPVEDLVAVRTDGSGYRRLTDDPYRDRTPRFSPDGQRIAFYSNRSGRYEIWEVRLDGSGLRQLSHHEGAESFYFPAWSPDGRRLAAVDQVGGIWLLDLDPPGRQWVPWRLAERSQMWVTSLDWSKDGRFFGWDMKGGGRQAGVFVEPLEGGARRRLTDSGEFPRWLRDSRRLLYLRDGGLCLLDTATGASSNVIARLKPSRTLFDFGLAADDRWLAYVELTRESDIWLMTLGEDQR